MDYMAYRDNRLKNDPALRRWHRFYTRWNNVRRIVRWILFGTIE